MMSLDNTLWLAGILTEAVVIGLLVYRRIWRLLPLFSIYCVWDLISNLVGFASQQYFPHLYNSSTYFGQTIADSLLQFGVLVELVWSVLRPLRQQLPRFVIVQIAALILLLAIAIWPFVTQPGLAQSSTVGRLIVHLQQTVAILRLLVFLALASCSQWLSISLRDRELQVATGLGFYSLVGLVAALLITHESNVSQYHYLNRFVVASFICSLLYWVFSFAQKEAARREFTPQMQNMLLAVAGVARADRAALEQSAKEEPVRKR
ncbi:MAG TPA: hypothetical protein VMI06_17460 [Terriglobia bacterium]|nr:hypothetical protein [Terriglobia bacterium]